MPNPRTLKIIKEKKRAGTLDAEGDRDFKKIVQAENYGERRRVRVEFALKDFNTIVPSDLVVEMLDPALAISIPRRLYKGVGIKIARVVFFRALDPIHNFTPRAYNITRVTYFVLSFAVRTGRLLSAFHQAFLAALDERRLTPRQFALREAFIQTWFTGPEELPRWRPTEMRRYKALSSQMGRTVKIAQKALGFMDEDEEQEEGEESESESVEEEPQTTAEVDLVDMFQSAMDGVQEAMKADVSLDEKMGMLSLLQGRGEQQQESNLTSQWESIAAGGVPANRQGSADDEIMEDIA